MVKKKKKKSEKEELKPEILERELTPIDNQNLREIGERIEASTVRVEQKDDSTDSFFKSIVKEMHDSENISSKTEYLSVHENFAGTRLEFLSDYAFMPFLKSFVNIFETKRVSLNRKGRQEMVMMLKERQQEMRRDKLENFSRMFGMSE